jgi:molybdenum cofactor synthesis domain-containing protein
MIPLDEAIATVLAGCRPLEPQVRPLADALGCVLVDDVTAAEAVPPFANTAMDGYAVRAADLATVPVELPVVAEVAAGHPATTALAPGQAMRIFTGAPLPDGADAVVMVERTSRLDGGARVEIRASVPPGNHVRGVGDDVKPGDVVVHAGDELTPGRIGVLRSVGVATVRVRPRPRVGVLSTGDELVTGDETLQPGQIRDSNRPTLLAMVASSSNAVPVDLGHVRDDEAALTAAFTDAVDRCDAVLSTGGVSMGDTDLVKVVLDRLGNAAGSAGSADAGGMRWMQVEIKPAKPLAFGVIGERRIPAFGLPGNPVSSMVSFELFARPGLRRLAGYGDDRLHRPRWRGVTDEPLDRRADGKVHFVRVVARMVDGVLRVRTAGGQGSHQLSAMARANALAVLPDGPGVAAGDPVAVVLLGDVASAPA